MNYIKRSKSAVRQVSMNDTVSAKEPDWVQTCIDVAKNNDSFRFFRSTKAFQRVIEGTPMVGGIWILKRLLKEAKFRKALPLIQTSDTLGLPLNMIDFTVSSSNNRKLIPITYNLSPTTIRYANNALNCVSLFGNKILNGKTEVYEIGAGYGGECKIFNDLAVTQFNLSFGKRWHIYDIPSSRGIIERFLSNFNYSASFDKLNSYRPKKGSNSLVISNAAFSEMRGSLLTAYFDSVIANAKFGYFITNFESHSAPYGGWTTSYFIKRLRACGKTNVAILPTTEYLSYFDQQAGSKLIVFGHKRTRKNNTRLKDIAKIRLISKITDSLDGLTRSFIKD